MVTADPATPNLLTPSRVLQAPVAKPPAAMAR